VCPDTLRASEEEACRKYTDMTPPETIVTEDSPRHYRQCLPGCAITLPLAVVRPKSGTHTPRNLRRPVRPLPLRIDDLGTPEA